MDWKRTLRVVAWWTSGQAGVAKSGSAPQVIHFTAPPELGGAEGRWTPEELFLGALASSLTTTFHALAGNSELEYTDLEIEVEGTPEDASPGDGRCFRALVVRPRLTVARPDDRERAMHLLQRVTTLCPILRALASAPKFETHVEVSKLAFAG